MALYSPKTEADLAAAIAEYYGDPYGFVLFVFPWGDRTLPDGSPNPLANKDGPEPWQAEFLIELGNHIRENAALIGLGLERFVWRSAIASGHGVGKSALVAWVIIFLMSTRVDTRIGVTANTQKQLEDKTWPELAKWHNLLINKHWFTWTATSYFFAQYPEDKRKNYMATAMTVSEHNTEAFAGLHNEAGTVAILFDEASGINAKIWEVANGALTDGEGFMFAFGNPTQPDGEFADCFDKYADMYYLRHVDARSVRHTNKTALNDIIRRYGPDSDEAKIRVYGQFPTQSYNGFIGMTAVEDCFKRDLVIDNDAGLIMAIDVAHMGGDEIVFGWRQGRDARSRPMQAYRFLRTEQIVELAMRLIGLTKPDIVVIEAIGPGIGVIDGLRARGVKVIEVYPGARALNHQMFFNRRTECWGLMREALDWLCLDEEPVLFQQLTKIQYKLDRHEQRIQLESKEDYKTRTGLSSPDRADTLALTFAVTAVRRDQNKARAANDQNSRNVAITEYDPLTY